MLLCELKISVKTTLIVYKSKKKYSGNIFSHSEYKILTYEIISLHSLYGNFLFVIRLTG
jgi:hypothetical protein